MMNLVAPIEIEDRMDASFIALATEEDPKGRGTGTLLVEAGT